MYFTRAYTMLATELTVSPTIMRGDGTVSSKIRKPNIVVTIPLIWPAIPCQRTERTICKGPKNQKDPHTLPILQYAGATYECNMKRIMKSVLAAHQ